MEAKIAERAKKYPQLEYDEKYVFMKDGKEFVNARYRDARGSRAYVTMNKDIADKVTNYQANMNIRDDSDSKVVMTVTLSFWAEPDIRLLEKLKKGEPVKAKIIEIEDPYKRGKFLKYREIKRIIFNLPGIKLFAKLYGRVGEYLNVSDVTKIRLIEEISQHYKQIKQIWANILSVVRYIGVDSVIDAEEKKVKKFEEIDFERSEPKICHPFIEYQGQTLQEVSLYNHLSNDYFHKNYKSFSCLYTAIIAQFKNSFDKTYKRNKLTYQYLYEFIHNTPYVPDRLPEKLPNVLPFFVKYRLILKVFNISGEIIFQYHPKENKKSENKMFAPNYLYALAHDNHIFLMNSDLKKLAQIEPSQTLTVNNEYHITEKPCDAKYIDNIEDIINMEIKENTVLLYNGDLLEIVRQFIHKYNYKPMITTQAGCNITRVMFKVNKFLVSIVNFDNTEAEPNIDIESQENCSLYNQLDFKLYHNIISKANCSKYNPDLLNTLKALMPVALFGRMNPIKKQSSRIATIDIARAYTHFLQSLDMLPVVNVFDNFEGYKGEPIIDNNLYIVGKGHPIAAPYEQNIVSGITVNELNITNIKYVLNVSTVRPNTCRSIIKEIYESKLTDGQKKFIPNKLTGKLEKIKNSKAKTFLFRTYNEAALMKEQMGGSIYTLKLREGIDKLNDNDNEMLSNLDYGCEVMSITEPTLTEDDYMYFLIANAEAELNEGFLPIKLMIYDYTRREMAKLYDKIHERYNVIAVNTDAFFIEVEKKDFEHMQALVDKSIHDKENDVYNFMGKYLYKWERSDNMPYCPIKYRVHENMVVKSPPQINEITINDEYSEDEFKKAYDSYNKVLVKAIVPGAGKTYSIVNFLKKNNKRFILVSPFNLQALEMKMADGIQNSMTLYNLTGTVLCDNFQEKQNDNKIDFSQFDSILFDEIFCYKAKDLYKIHKFMNEHPELKYYATGDVDQNRPINDVTVENWKQYYTDIIQSLFPNVITLKVSKRFKNEHDKVRIHQIKADVFNTDISIIDICKKHFKMIHTYEEIQGFAITYKNTTSIKVNKFLHRDTEGIDINGINYYEGMYIRCRSFIKLGNDRKNIQKLRINFTYEIQSIDEENKQLVIKDVLEEKLYTISFKLLKHFTLTYAGTGHSTQGLTIKKPITVMDVDYEHVTREWFWTAITRSQFIDEIYIYNKPGYNHNEFLQVASGKINTYISTDSKKGFKCKKSDYVDVQWIREQMKLNKGCCCECGVVLDITPSLFQFSVNRINNNLPHIKSNCNVVCVHCNVKNH